MANSATNYEQMSTIENAIHKPKFETTESPQLQAYREQHGILSGDLDELQKRWNRFAFARGSIFLASIFVAVLGFASYLGLTTFWFVLAGLVFLGFLVVAFVHVGIEDEMFRKRLEIRFARTSIAQFERDWDQIPEINVPENLLHSPVAVDLDLFGKASLMKLICAAETPIGQHQLAEWILQMPNADSIVARQLAVHEMSGWSEHREKLRLLGRLITTQHSDPFKLVGWADSSSDDVAGPLVIWLARALTIFQFVALILFAVQLVSLPWYLGLLAGGLTVAFLTTVIISGRIHEIFNQVAAHQHDAENYLGLFHLIGNARAEAAYLKDLQHELTAGSVSAVSAFASLKRIMVLANMRRSGMGYFLYLALQFLFMWDVHALVMLRSWRERFGKYVSDWFDAVGKWEAIASMAKLAADYPDWVFPNVENQRKREAVFVANGLGHPLLRGDERVANDVTVGPAGSILLVTGSNMSGKSTLLRSIGLNTILAQMGSVTCAKELSMPCVELQTSIRIADSLADGVSYYFAELKRLKEVVEAAKQRQPDNDRVLLYLLDEILQGTNSRERQIAVGKVLEHLVASEAIGAISTHDLELASNDSLKQAFRPVHFRETIVNTGSKREMTFDYQMRAGIATTTNALELLRLVGLSR